MSENEITYYAIFKQSPLGMFTADSDGNILQVNEAFLGILDYSNADMQDVNIVEFCHPDDVEANKKIFSELNFGFRDSFEIENRYYKKDGTLLWVNVTVNAIREKKILKHVFGIVQDVTERKVAEIALKQSEERLRLALEGANEGFWEWHVQTDDFILDPVILKMLDYDISEIDPSFDSFKKLLALEDRDYVMDYFYRFINSDEKNFTIEFRLQTKEGNNKWFVSNGRIAERDDINHTVMVYGVLRDISFQKNSEEQIKIYSQQLEKMVKERTRELEQKTQRLEESQQAMTFLLEDVNESRQSLESVNQELEVVNKELQNFAYIVSHDLKAPLRAVSQLSYWIAEDYADRLDSDGQEKIRLLISRVQRMNKLIEGILQYSRVGRIKEKREPVDVKSIVKRALDFLSPPAMYKISYSEDLPIIMADAIRVEQIFQNLLDNSIKYMDKEQGIISINYIKQDEFIEFLVSDNGPGIDAKYHDKIFQIFQTLSPRDEIESTGIGLTLVKKIVENYGGKITVESEIKQGTTFRISLPQSIVIG